MSRQQQPAPDNTTTPSQQQQAVTMATGSSPACERQQRCWCLDYAKPCTIQERFSGVPYDKPLSVSCDVEYELDMKLFPGYKDERAEAAGARDAQHQMALAIDYSQMKVRQGALSVLQHKELVTAGAAAPAHSAHPARGACHSQSSFSSHYHAVGSTLDTVNSSSLRMRTRSVTAAQQPRLQPSYTQPPSHLRPTGLTQGLTPATPLMTSQQFAMSQCEACNPVMMTSQQGAAPAHHHPQPFPGQPQYYRTPALQEVPLAARPLAPPAPPHHQFVPIPMGPMGPPLVPHKSMMLGSAAPPVSQPMQGRAFALCGRLTKPQLAQHPQHPAPCQPAQHPPAGLQERAAQPQPYKLYHQGAYPQPCEAPPLARVSPQAGHLPPHVASQPISIQGAAEGRMPSATYRRALTSRQRPSPYDKPALGHVRSATCGDLSAYGYQKTAAPPGGQWAPQFTSSLLDLNRDLRSLWKSNATTHAPPVTMTSHTINAGTQCCAVY